MEVDEGIDVDVRHAVAIRQLESAVLEPWREPSYPAAGVGEFARLDQMHLPVLVRLLVVIDSSAGEIDREAAHESGVFSEESLDELALVPQRNGEVVQTKLGISLEDVPEDRTTADLDHWLGSCARLLGQSCAETTGKDCYTHSRFLL